TPSPEIAGKRLELLKEATGASRIAVLWNPARRYPYIELAQREVNASAQVLGIKLRVVEARGPDQFEAAFAGMVRGQTEALLTLEDSMFWLNRRVLAKIEAEHRLPMMHPPEGACGGGQPNGLRARSEGFVQTCGHLRGQNP